MKSWVPILTVAAIIVVPAATPRAQQAATDASAALKPTNHPRLPADVSKLWMAPTAADKVRSPAIDAFAAAVRLEVDGNFGKALPMLSTEAVQQGTLGHYAEDYKGLAQLRLGASRDA